MKHLIHFISIEKKISHQVLTFCIVLTNQKIFVSEIDFLMVPNHKFSIDTYSKNDKAFSFMFILFPN